MAFRENLLHLRAANNMTQEQLAMLVGVSRQSVAKWESGKAYPEMDKLIKMSQIFDCSLDDLVQGDMTDREAAPGKQLPDTAQDIFGYDEFMRTFARKISNGVMFIILGVACSMFFFPIMEAAEGGGMPAYAESVFGGLGVLVLFIGIAFGLLNLIPAGMEHSAFVKEHPYLVDFYTQSQKLSTRKAFANQLVVGIIFIFAGVCLVTFLSVSEEVAMAGTCVMLVCIAIGVRLIVHGGIMLSRVDIAAYNAKTYEEMTPEEIAASDMPANQKEYAIKAKEHDERIGAWCGIIMVVATIVGLVMLFVPQYQNDLFWLAWPIGGLLCGVVSLMFKALKGDE